VGIGVGGVGSLLPIEQAINPIIMDKARTKIKTIFFFIISIFIKQNIFTNIYVEQGQNVGLG
jgi:hypothetical protein